MGSLTLIIGIFLSSLLDYCFPVYDAEKGVSTLMVEVIIQTIFLSIVIYYIPKISKLVPYLGDNNYNFTEYNFKIITSMVLVASQINYLKKIQHIIKVLKKNINKIRVGDFSSKNTNNIDAKNYTNIFCSEDSIMATSKDKLTSFNSPIFSKNLNSCSVISSPSSKTISYID